MKKHILYILIIFMGLNMPNAYAYTDKDVYAKIYHLIEENYIHQVDKEKLMIESLKGLNLADKNIVVADDNKRVSLYYKGKIIKSYLKPQDKSISSYAEYMQKITQEAKKISPIIQQKDFELADILLARGVEKSLDGYSKYYPMMNEEQDKYPHSYISKRIENFLYVKILVFNRHTLSNLQNSLSQYKDTKGLILDLRGSKGGSLSETLKIADIFLDQGIIIISKDKRGNKEFFEAKSGDEYEEKPIVVLVDGDTSSSAEILAMAIQTQSRGKIIGTQTYGKGSRQKLYLLENNSELGITNGYFYSADGVELNKRGVIPNICTRGLNEVGNIDKFIESQHQSICTREARADQNLELELAKHILELEI